MKYINMIQTLEALWLKLIEEGQPGPQNYQRTHADWANMLGDALAPHGGIVIWRAFVYSNETPVDRTKQAYLEFKPFDGQFKPNVIVQVKNGPLDFQPREPFHPLFGAMPKTPLMMEFQLTQEYLGQATHLVYEAPLMTEVLDADTYANGKGSTVAKVVSGSLGNFALNGMAGVANIGDDRNWTGHPFAQANWYAYGKLAWNPSQNTGRIAEDWIKMSWDTDSHIFRQDQTDDDGFKKSNGTIYDTLGAAPYYGRRTPLWTITLVRPFGPGRLESCVLPSRG